MPSSVPLSQPEDRAPTHFRALADALSSEQRLLDELARVLVAQRDGISQDDLDALDGSVFSAHRVFRTLQEARARRRSLLELVGVPSDTSLKDLAEALGPRMTDEVSDALGALLSSAEALARELQMNRRVIDGAMAVGERLLRLFTGAEQQPALYAAKAGPDVRGNAGSLLNTRV